MPNWRIKARERPHSGQRLYFRVLYFGFRSALTIKHFRDTTLPLFPGARQAPCIPMKSVLRFDAPDGEAQPLEKGAGFIVRVRRCRHRHIHT